MGRAGYAGSELNVALMGNGTAALEREPLEKAVAGLRETWSIRSP